MEMRQRALEGSMTGNDPTTLTMPEHVRFYIARCTALWEPDSVVLIFTRDDVPGYVKGWHLVVMHMTSAGLAPVDKRLAQKWCELFFPHQLAQVKHRFRTVTKEPTQFHYYLEVADWETERQIIV